MLFGENADAQKGNCWSRGHVAEVFCTQNETNGGSRDTGTNVLAAIPSRTPSASAAIATTPDGKWLKALARRTGSGECWRPCWIKPTLVSFDFPLAEFQVCRPGR